MQQVLLVGTGGFLGAVSRFAITGWIHRKFPNFLPAGTLIVNVMGCLTIGFLMVYFIDLKPGPEEGVSKEMMLNSQQWKLLLITGVLASLTTFSTFSYETVDLLQQEKFRFALWNIVGNFGIGLLAVVIGKYCGDFFFEA